MVRLSAVLWSYLLSASPSLDTWMLVPDRSCHTGPNHGPGRAPSPLVWRCSWLGLQQLLGGVRTCRGIACRRSLHWITPTLCQAFLGPSSALGHGHMTRQCSAALGSHRTCRPRSCASVQPPLAGQRARCCCCATCVALVVQAPTPQNLDGRGGGIPVQVA